MKIKHQLIKLAFGLTLCLVSLNQVQAQVEVTNYGDIPEARLAASRWDNYSWKDPGNWTTIDVTKEGITAGGSGDIVPKLQSLIDEGSGNRIYKFPAGNFNFKSDLVIKKSNIQIVGAGSSTKFLATGGNNPGSLKIAGSKSGDYKVTQNVNRGSNTVTLDKTDGISVGTYIMLTQEGDGPRGGDPEGQIVKVTAKDGNKLTVDMKFGIPFYSSKATALRFSMVENVRLSDFYFERTTAPTPQGDGADGRSHNLELSSVQNVEIKNVELKRVLSTHIDIIRCTNLIIRDCKISGNYGGGGGKQGGIVANFSTKVYMINNETSDIRHHFATQFGTNHCVIAYNRASPPYNDYGDYGQHNSKGCHNNLFEGNYGSEILDDNNMVKGWGTRYTMWYRNHATKIIGADHADANDNNIIGNEFKSSSQSSAIAKGKNNLVGGNIFGINKEGGTGNLVWKDLNANASLPASLFLKDKPSYAERWPLYGPKAGTLSVADVSYYKNANVYPNPAQNLLNFEIDEEKGTVYIYNQLGSEIKKSNTLKNIDVSDLGKGIYVYQIKTIDGAVYKGKISKY